MNKKIKLSAILALSLVTMTACGGKSKAIKAKKSGTSRTSAPKTQLNAEEQEKANDLVQQLAADALLDKIYGKGTVEKINQSSLAQETKKSIQGLEIYLQKSTDDASIARISMTKFQNGRCQNTNEDKAYSKQDLSVADNKNNLSNLRCLDKTCQYALFIIEGNRNSQLRHGEGREDVVLAVLLKREKSSQVHKPIAPVSVKEGASQLHTVADKDIGGRTCAKLEIDETARKSREGQKALPSINQQIAQQPVQQAPVVQQPAQPVQKQVTQRQVEPQVKAEGEKQESLEAIIPEGL